LPEAPHLLSAEEASQRLGVRPASLYAYVSRGLVRALPHPDDPRARLYESADIDALIERKRRHARPAAAAATALDWGLPVLTTSISSIADGRLAYRGRDAVELSEAATLEETAALLWQMPAPDFEARPSPPSLAGSPIDRAVAALAADLPATLFGERGERLARRANREVGRIAAAVAGGPLDTGLLHVALAKAWNAPDAADAIRRALILVADHELNASTFAVRVAASTGASLTHAILAGLVTLAGPIHGGATQRVAAFLDEVERIGDANEAVRARLARGESIPGFGHRLYPNGDPRALALLATVPLAPEQDALLASVEAATGELPSIDVALAILERNYALPRDAALALFAIGRSVGWIAHAMEQAETGQLIRPRAMFLR
jgi:citrate synthase